MAGLLLMALLPRSVAAYGIVVDGSSTDWFAVAPTNLNTAHIARDSAGRGEFVWTDLGDDTRTDLTFPASETVADLQRFSLTADSAHLYVLAEMASGGGSPPPMIQVAIDLDRVPASGQTFFAGFADTSVSSAAAWEYLVQTRFGSGNAAPFVYDTGFVDQGAAAANVLSAGGTIEIRIPWTALGLSGGPTAPIRFTVAVFRTTAADQTIDVGGVSVSDALDALTHYGDPATSGATNTFSEVSDGVVDHHFDVSFHLDPELDPSAPLLISEIGYDTSGGLNEEWIEIVNRSDTTVDLAGHVLSDEETTNGSEASLAFPSGAAVVAGGYTVVARSSSAFLAAQGVGSDFEFSDSSPGIPDMVPALAWSFGSTPALANSGDEVLLLDPFLTVLDAVPYEGGSYPSVVASPGSTVDQTLARTPPSEDTDDASLDFLAGNPTPGTGPIAGAVPMMSAPAQIVLLLSALALAKRRQGHSEA